jgi:leader peptidase (prepilin peptidase)/N-methyltransferase
LRIESASYAIGALWLLGASAISLACWRAPQPNWVALLTALAGVAVGGGVIWIVRFVGGLTLRREAMGFGDVTLMSMIGAFVGWQPSLIIFFLAPFAGLAVGLAQWILHRENEIPFGPFLCLATLAVILDWDNMWDRTADIFALAWLLVAVLAVCMALMGLMLSVYRILRDRIAR